MRRCGHRSPYDVASVDILNEAEPRVSLLGQRRCMDCGEIVPYGPAWDGGEHAMAIGIELRAAQIIADDYMLWQEALGFDCGEESEPAGSREHSPSWHAGYLARCIATHPDGGDE